MLRSLINQRLGRYYIKELLGRGGMAAVYRAVDTVLQRDVALKVLYPQFSDDAALLERFTREAVTAAALEHPHIVPVYDVGEHEGMAYIAMKLLTGRTLQDRLQEAGTLGLDELLEVLEPVASALDYAHERGVVHRDIKPGNIFLSDDPDGPRVLLTDFGIAKQLDTPGLTTTGALIGTPDYMPPEQIAGQTVGPQSDVYALGMLAYRALTGQRAFAGSTQDVLLGHLYGQPVPPSQRNPALPAGVDAVFSQATARDPAARYPRASAFVAALRQVARGAAAPTLVGATPGAPAPPAHPPLEPPALRPGPLPAPQLAGAATLAAEAVAPHPGVGRGAGARGTGWIATIVLAVLAGGLAVGLGFVLAGRGTSGDATPVPPPPATPSSTATSAPSPIASPEPPSPTSLPPSPTSEPPTPIAPPPTSPPTETPAATATATASPTPTATETASPTPTATETASPTPSATPAEVACPDGLLQGGFGRLFKANVNVRVGLGCPLAAEVAGAGSVQFFERGTMFYWDEANRTRWRDYVFVFEGRDEGAYLALSATAVAALGPEPTPGSAPDQPARGFGRVYFYQPGVSEALGAWTSPEIALRDDTLGVIQFFEQGTMIYTPIYRSAGRASIFVLYNSGMFERYDDSFGG